MRKTILSNLKFIVIILFFLAGCSPSLSIKIRGGILSSKFKIMSYVDINNFILDINQIKQKLDGNILFNSNKTGKEQIYLLDINNGILTQLTDNSLNNILPNISNNKDKIVFCASLDKYLDYDIYTMDITGNNIVKLTTGKGNKLNPSWCGNKIIFSSNITGNNDLYIMDSDGTNLTNLTNTPYNECDPVCSSDGKKFLFYSDKTGNNEIYIMNSDGTLFQVTNNKLNNFDPSWGLEEKKIIFSSLDNGNNRNLYMINSDGTNLIKLSNNNCNNVRPYWTNKDIVLYSSNCTGNYELYLIDLNKKENIQITNNKSNNNSPVWFQTMTNTNPTFTPTSVPTPTLIPIPAPTSIPTSSPTLIDESNYNINVEPNFVLLPSEGSTQLLIVSVKDKKGKKLKGVDNFTVKWDSLNPNIAIVNEVGQVRATGWGETKIRVRFKNLTTEANIIVKDISPKKY